MQRLDTDERGTEEIIERYRALVQPEIAPSTASLASARHQLRLEPFSVAHERNLDWLAHFQ